ncbi:MAG: type II toxin-antitoxin system VapC family toxin [Magnetococcus sp. YQC-9]
MYYFDTSAIVPLFLNESTTEEVERFVLGLSDGELAVSHWTGVEFSSLLAREVRMGGLSSSDALRVDEFFSRVIVESFVTFLCNARRF